jgi:dihydrofolate reductase
MRREEQVGERSAPLVRVVATYDPNARPFCDSSTSCATPSIRLATLRCGLASRDGRVCDRINSIPKYVATSHREGARLEQLAAIEGSVADAVRELKHEPGQNILMYGTGIVARELMKQGLVDEYHLWIHPVIVGAGTRLFVDGFTRRSSSSLAPERPPRESRSCPTDRQRAREEGLWAST